MTDIEKKRQEIRLQAYRLFCQHCQALQKTMGWKGKPCWVIQYNEPEAICTSAIDAIDGLFNYQDSQGVVIKVDDKELPEPHFHPPEMALIRFIDDLKKAGFAGYERLIPLKEGG